MSYSTFLAIFYIALVLIDKDWGLSMYHLVIWPSGESGTESCSNTIYTAYCTVKNRYIYYIIIIYYLSLMTHFCLAS